MVRNSFSKKLLTTTKMEFQHERKWGIGELHANFRPLSKGLRYADPSYIYGIHSRIKTTSLLSHVPNKKIRSVQSNLANILSNIGTAVMIYQVL